MKLRWVAALSVAIACLLFPDISAYARAPAIPKDADGFTEFMRDRFAEAMTDSQVSVKGALMLSVQIPGQSHTVYLSNVWDYCERDRRSCRRQLDEFVTNMSGTIREKNDDIKAEDIRVIVRTAGYVADMTRATAKSPEKQGIVRPVAGDIWMICAVDMPQGITLLNHEMIAKLGLSEDQAIALGLKNLAATLPPLAAETHVMKQIGLTYAAGNFYESSRILLHDDWGAMSKDMHGHLVVAIPANDMLIYGNGGGTATALC